jgi:decaprenylphospho-beta-D-erythro-pentofuranosid-2-ulose 2-reductase
MENAFGQPQNVVVLGGTSDIARAIALELVRTRTREVVLAGRKPDELAAAARELVLAGATSTAVVTFDAEDPSKATQCVSSAFDQIAGPVDLVIIAVGAMGDQDSDENDAVASARMITVNFTWPVAALAEIRRRLVAQGSGRILVISSVAAIRVRRASYLYSGAKAGLDRLCEGLADSLEGTGVSLQILRPGFVRTKMTTGLKEAPFSTDPDAVARDVIKGLATSHRVITSPHILVYLFAILRHLPAPLWKKINESR